MQEEKGTEFILQKVWDIISLDHKRGSNYSKKMTTSPLLNNSLKTIVGNLRSLKTEYISFFGYENQKIEDNYLKLNTLLQNPNKYNINKINLDKEENKVNKLGKEFVLEVLDYIKNNIEDENYDYIDFYDIKEEIKKIKGEVLVSNEDLNFYINDIFVEKLNKINEKYEGRIKAKLNEKRLNIKSAIIITIGFSTIFFLLGLWVNC